MSEDALKEKIRELESELEKKERESHTYFDKIEQLEDMVMQLEAIIQEEDTGKKSKKRQAADVKFAYELAEKDKEIRELKNRMGHLRKDYSQIKQEYERLKNDLKDSSVIRVEDLREKSPLNSLVAELQEKVNKQKSFINQMEDQIKKAEEFNDTLLEKEEIIESYKNEINNLNLRLNELSSTSEDEGTDSVTKKLIEDLQKQLNKAKRQIMDLNQKLSKSEKKNKKAEKKSETSKLDKQIQELNQLLATKDDEIENLKEKITIIGKVENITNLDATNASSDMIKTLKDDLQDKLNKSKSQIKRLQEELRKAKAGSPVVTSESPKEFEGKLKMQRDMASFLQKQLETKEGEIDTIKNEAMQIKKRYRQLENQLKTRDQKLIDLQQQVERHTSQTPAQPQENPHLSIRLKELKGIIDDLKLEIRDQRLEIAELRKK
jgi:chromosome segregation ATPase